MTLWARIDALVNKLAKNYTLWIFVGLLVLTAIAVKAYHVIFPAMPQPAVYGSLSVPGQGWADARRAKFYQTSQGNPVIPFYWFMSLERQPQGFPPKLGEVDLFSSPKVQARYGLLPETSTYNPYLLPVGIVKDVLADDVVDLLGQGQKEWVGMSCAACHTGQILYKGRAVRIDGGQAMWNFSQWSSDLVTNLTLTAAMPKRFNRFAKRVFAYQHLENNEENRKTLRQQLQVYLNSPLVHDAFNAIFNHTYPTVEGNTRTAALGRGVNGEFGLLDQRNIDRNHGPVSFPPLWYTHDYDWVQSVAAILQPMGRNITEAWGVNVQVEFKKPNRYVSTARLNDLFWMETLLSTLTPPAWPQDVLGPIDPQKVERGRYLYEKAVWPQALTPEQEQVPAGGGVRPPNPNQVRTGYCARCHAPTLQTEADAYGNRYIQLPMYRLDVLDTDPYDAQEFNARKPYTGILADDFKGQKQVGIGEALTTIVSGIEQRWYDDRQVPPRCREIMNGFRPQGFRAPLAYPARPLAGCWATGPYLHNGSVRTLFQLLSPVEKREKSFYIGSYEFDPKYVGYRNDRIDGAFVYDTQQPGNYNTGHEFRNAEKGTKGVIGPFLSEEDRLAIIEYMKVMDDVAASGLIPPQATEYRKRLLDVMTYTYEGKAGVQGYEAADKPMAELCQKLESAMDQLSGGAQKTQSYIASPAPGPAPPSTVAAPAPTPAPAPSGH
ncbi:MAG TPA: di-heme-cytochrome C peroxidase [Thermoanaerobaculia bacterium]|jgi:hypothetical protein|nr:di-heme-cytochrome C peroxidase [Thermoanaerobaculia bacterium]